MIIKTCLSIIGLLFLVIIPVYQNNFYRKSALSEWKQLTWDDFQGTHPPFTGWGAVIHSEIVLDSSNAQLKAKAIQDNLRSFKTKGIVSSNYALRHEQVHFNITEAFTRKFNATLTDEIASNPKRLDSAYLDIRYEMRRWQHDYDFETDHGLVDSIQYQWELKVDSMLWAYDLEKFRVEDQFTGASIAFPYPFDFKILKRADESTADRRVILSRYGVDFLLESFHYPQSIIEYKSYLDDRLETEPKKAIKYEVGDEHIELIFYDSLSETVTFQYLYSDYPLGVLAHVEFDGKRQDSLLLTQVCEAFISSLEIRDATLYWSHQANQYAPSTVKELVSGENELSLEDYGICNNKALLESIAFVGKTINLEGDSVLIPFEPFEVAREFIGDYVLHTGKKLFIADVKDGIALFKMAKKDFSEGLNLVEIGYVLENDLTDGCGTFYYQPYSFLMDDHELP